ncbi:glycosyltransferase [candidate division KSB1 bacterium]|nr:glycosyltransferase [candidate division KSB1 bacterium]
MKILQVVDGFRMGGAETKLCELVERLDPAKYENVIANVGPAGPLADRFLRLGVPIFQCQRKHRFDLAPFFQIRKIVKEHQIDVVQTTLFWADFVGTLAARTAGAPVVISWETVSHEGDSYHHKLQRRAGYRLAMYFTDKVVAVSHEIKESLIRRRGLDPDKIEVIHYGVDLEKFHPNGGLESKRHELGFKDEEIAIAIVARLEEVKGHRYFIEAFRTLTAKYSHISSIFVGDGNCRRDLENMVHETGLHGRIRFLGIRKDVNEILNAIDILVLPSIAGEGLPNVILEAMACGKPVIATTVGGAPEAIRDGENGFLVPPKNVIAMHEALETILSARDKISQYSQKSRAIAEREFSLQKQLTSFQMLYNNLYHQNVLQKKR